ncbi:MAG: signal peptidase II [Oscillospiraceae bacterium]
MIYNILFAVLLIAADQGFKFLATLYLQNAQPIVLIPHFLGLTYTLNPGAAFSMFSGKVNMLIILTSVALGVIAYFVFIKKIDDKIESFCFLLIFAGGVGNLIDRIMAGMVVDYLEFLFIDFPIFNFADTLVCCGVGLFAIYTIYTEFLLARKKGDK